MKIWFSILAGAILGALLLVAVAYWEPGRFRPPQRAEVRRYLPGDKFPIPSAALCGSQADLLQVWNAAARGDEGALERRKVLDGTLIQLPAGTRVWIQALDSTPANQLSIWGVDAAGIASIEILSTENAGRFCWMPLPASLKTNP
jgi:hypothetical protein